MLARKLVPRSSMERGPPDDQSLLTLLKHAAALPKCRRGDFAVQLAEARMTRHEAYPKRSEVLKATATLRDLLDRLAATDRLSIMRRGVGLVYELAAIAKRLDGTKATFFPHPDGH